MGECYYDMGGYFIISGKEKTVICQEKFGDNMIYIKEYNDTLTIKQPYIISAEIHSVSEDPSKPIRYTAVRMVAQSAKFLNKQLVIDIPNVTSPVPLFILMRALGVISDKAIIEMCLLDMDKNENLIDLFIPSIHNANKIFTQQLALEYISTFVKRKTISATMEILMNYFLPHVGELNFLDKAYFIGFMVYKLLRVYNKQELSTDRDNFKYKRVELSGNLIYNLFREYYQIQNRNIETIIDKEFYYNVGQYNKSLESFISLVYNNQTLIFKEKIVETGFKKAFKGNWGATSNTKKLGVVQDLNRLSWNSFISHLRKINLQMDAGSKLVKPRLLNSSQWGIIDPVDTPDGGNIGTHKHLSLGAIITSGTSAYPIIHWIKNTFSSSFKILQECTPKILSRFTKIFINGIWIGIMENPIENVNLMKLYRRNGLIPIYTSITYNFESNIIYIYTDSGRLMRPIYYIENGKPSYDREYVLNILRSKNFKWDNLTSGFMKKNDENYDTKNGKIYEITDLYSSEENNKDETEEVKEISKSKSKSKEKSKSKTKQNNDNIDNDVIDIDVIDNNDNDNDNNNDNDVELQYTSKGGNKNTFLEKYKAIIDYMDTSEEENVLIAMTPEDMKYNKYYTHLEIDPSLILGVLGNLIPFPECNQLPRDLFSCGHSKQAVGVFHSNYQLRIDKTVLVLNNGQVPLIKSKYLEYFNEEQLPYGVNTIVAIMSYTGYNVEDAILINEGSIKRGLFRTTYYTGYQSYEESSKVSGKSINSYFSNVLSKAVTGIKRGADYTHLDEFGLVKENTPVNDKTVLIGKIVSDSTSPTFSDDSTVPKKGQLGYVDKAFITEGEEGFRIAKVRIREMRIPSLGDKMASRNGQKGTVGLIIPEQDMPYAEDGTRPDIIINPHALPSRMTIGQLVECLFGKVCCLYGAYGNCTAFSSNGPNTQKYGELLNNVGFHSSGNQVLYSGYTGEQLHSDIFIGPTYYMRLKHMVKDKINYRSTGPRTILTRQSVHGRALDGGLRLGEMEKDGLIAHGMSKFLNASFLDRGDAYYMAICNKTGTIAIYNDALNLFLSPFSDGPVQFETNLNGNLNIKSITRFGRSFSILKVPYSLKLAMQELQAMNVQLRIITEENINNLMNMSYSNNLSKILKVDEPLEQFIPDYVKLVETKLYENNQKYLKINNIYTSVSQHTDINLYQKEQEIEPKIIPKQEYNKTSKYTPKSPDYSPPQYNPKSPNYPPESPQYNPKSKSPEYPPPQYTPKSPDYPPPQYNSKSPDYPPESPQYNPNILTTIVDEAKTENNKEENDTTHLKTINL